MAPGLGPGPPKVFAILQLPDGAIVLGTYARGVVRSASDQSTWVAVTGGPGTGSVNALMATPDAALLAATNGSGVHRSTDGGFTWSALGRGLESASVYALAQVGETVVAGIVAGGIAWLSPDQVSWRRLDGDHRLRSTTVFRVMPTATGHVLAATEAAGVWLLACPSDEARVLATGLAGCSVHALARVSGGGILAGTSGAGVHRSTDGGHSWHAAGDGLPDPVVHSLLVTPDGSVLAGTGAGVARSTDGGRSWAIAGTGLAGRRIFSLAVDDGGDAYAGSYDGVWRRRSFEADTWTRLDTGLAATDVYCVALDPQGEFVAGGAGHIWTSSDGASWDSAGDGVGGRVVHGFSWNATADVRLAATDRGVLTTGRDAAWAPAGLDDQCVLCVSTTSAGRLVAGTLGGGLWQSPGGAGSWSRDERVTEPLVPDAFRTSDGRVLIATVDARSGAKTGGVYALDGDRLERLNVPAIACYRVVEHRTRGLVVGAQRCTVLVSADGGMEWQVYDTTGLLDSKLYALCVDTKGDIYIGTDAGVMCSADGAVTWHDCSAGLDGATPYALAVDSAGTLVAGTSRGLRKWRAEKSFWD